MSASAEARFRQAPQDQRDVVRLHFPQTVEKVSLYAHRSFLSLWSGVLRNALEHATATSAQQAQANADPDCTIASIPMDDAETAAWEDALSLMYPSVPMFQVTWDNASRLLLLADKYDMPCITEHVKLFLSGQQGGTSRLQQYLTAGNVFEWLRITSRVGLPDSAKLCISYIVGKSLPLPPGFLTCIPPDTLQQLFDAQQVQTMANRATIMDLSLHVQTARQQASNLESEVAELRADLRDAAKRVTWENCSQCNYALFRKPNGKYARGGGFFCLNCGAHNP